MGPRTEMGTARVEDRASKVAVVSVTRSVYISEAPSKEFGVTVESNFRESSETFRSAISHHHSSS